MNDFELFFGLGLKHIMSFDALDHLLFLSALTVVFSPKDIKKLLLLISVFTFSHTLALALTAYGAADIPSEYVETAILFTILLTALVNVLISDLRLLQKWHLLSVFFFGLIHGSGFAEAFLMSVSGTGKIAFPLLSFAVGIETGQILFIFLFLSIIHVIFVKILKVDRRKLIRALSWMIIGFTLAMFKK